MGDIGDTIDKLNKSTPPPLPPAPPGMPPGCAGSTLPAGCMGTTWIMTPRFTNATRISTGQKGIQIYQCDRFGHFCASDGNQGEWGAGLALDYYNVPNWQKYSLSQLK